jgi:microcystin-dependent protein
MAAVTRRQYKGAAVSTTITAGINSSATTCALAANTGWPSSSGVPFYVVIDPGTSTEEKCSATIAGTTLTLTRGQDDTTAAAHASGAVIYPVFSADEADEANLFTSTMTTRGDLLTMGSGPTVARLAVSSNSGYVLTSDGTDPVWGQVAAAGLASDAVTTVKILDSAVTSAKIANATIVQGDIALTLLKALCPVGTIVASVAATAPTGWILCDGTAVVSGTHPELYALCSTTPDLRGRTVIGVGTGAGLSARTLNATGGTETHALTTAELATHSHANTLTNNAGTFTGNLNTTSSTAHVHDVPFSLANTVNAADTISAIPDGNGTVFYSTQNDGADGAHSHTVTPSGSVSTNVTISNVETGSGTAHNNMQPFYALNYIIKHDYV